MAGAQYPPGTLVTDVVRQLLREHGRDLDRYGAPFSDADFAALNAGVTLSGRIYATGRAEGQGAARALGRGPHKRGPKDADFQEAMRLVAEDIRSGKLYLPLGSVRSLARIYGYDQSVMKKVKAVVLAISREHPS